MSRISLTQARSGQKVVRSVINNNGVVLVQAGTPLTEPLIDRLRGLGVTTVFVAGSGPGAAPRTTAERVAELEQRFSAVIDDPLMRELYDVVRAQIPESEA